MHCVRNSDERRKIAWWARQEGGASKKIFGNDRNISKRRKGKSFPKVVLVVLFRESGQGVTTVKEGKRISSVQKSRKVQDLS